MDNYIVYDFDGTIYSGDSSIDLFLVGFISSKKKIKYLYNLLKAIFKYKTGTISKEHLKEIFFQFLAHIKYKDEFLTKFVTKHKKKIKKFYKNQEDHSRDIIITASPEFLVEKLCEDYNVHKVIGSRIDLKSGRYIGKNCEGIEKVARLKELYGDIVISKFYTDSLKDLPLIDISTKAYRVKGSKVKEWKRE